MEQMVQMLGSALEGIKNEIGFHAGANNIPVWYGDKNGCEDFIRCVDMCHTMTGSDLQTVRAAASRSKGMVAEVLKTYMKDTPQLQISWATAKKALEQQFGPPSDSESCLQILRNTKQESHQNIAHFAQLLAIRAPRAWPDADMTSEPYQKQVVEIFLRGLQNDHIRRKLIIKNPATLKDARDAAISEETVQSRLASYGLPAQSKVTPAPPPLARREIPMEIDHISPAMATAFEIDTQQLPADAEYYPYSAQLFTTPQDDMTGYYEQAAGVPTLQEEDPNYVQEVPTQEDSMVEYSEEALQSSEIQPDDPGLYAVDGYTRLCWYCSSPAHLQRSCPLRQQRFTPTRPRYTLNTYGHPATPQVRYGYPFVRPVNNFMPRFPSPRYPQRFPSQPHPSYRQPSTQAYGNLTTPLTQNPLVRPQRTPAGQTNRPARPQTRPKTNF